jgi:hypothetical protein
LEHPLNAGVHLVFFDKFATRNLVDAYLHLLLEPLRVGQHLRDRLLYQFVRASAGLRGELIKLDFLVLGQVHFHGFSVGRYFPSVKSKAQRRGRGALQRQSKSIDRAEKPSVK